VRQQVPLAQLVTTMRNGTTTNQNDENRGVPVTRIETISDGTIDSKRVRHADISPKDIERWRLLPGDILFSHINSVDHIGKSALYNGLPEVLIHGMNLLLMRPDQTRVLPEYLHYALRSEAIRSHVRARCKRAINQASINQKELGSIEISVPPLSDQHRAVDLLTRAESIVRMRQEAEQMAKEVIAALFLHMFGDPATNPKGWTVRPIGEVIQSAQYGTSTKASTDGAGLPMIRMGNVDFVGRMSLGDLKFVELSPADEAKYRLLAGDILFNRTNSKDLVGKTGIWRDGREAVAASYFIRVRVDESKVAPDYLWAFMNSRHMKMVLFGTARGAIGQSNINAQELRGLHVPLPPIGMQRRFAQIVVQSLELENQQSRATMQSDQAFRTLLAGVFGA
jgi:type I restriction enzyme S subunit